MPNFLKRTREYKEMANEIVIKIPKICDRCGEKAHVMPGTTILLCSWKSCKYKASLFKNTAFENNKHTIHKILKIYDCWLHRLNIDAISFVLRVSKKYVMNALRKLANYAVDK
ncbi:hypothetical protein ENBRE01_2176 [Enteropsectra breve]|nr:hypothetical protein ENBRE01_2176 [Enteropsectra breve]